MTATAMDRATYNRWLAEGAYDAPSEITLAPGERRPAHTHPFSVRGLVTAGTLVLVGAGAEERFAEGETFELPRDCEHYEAAGAEGARYLAGRLA